MSNVLSGNGPEDVIAIACSDLHFCHKKPVCRTPEPDWYTAMSRSFSQLKLLSEFFNGKVPTLIAGDVFDRWNAPAELINFAMAVLPENCWSIPGQHDLPNHNYEDIQRSAYWTLVSAGVLNNLLPGKRTAVGHKMFVTGFPWNYEIHPATAPRPPSKGPLSVAICHAYIHTKSTGYHGADKSTRVSGFKDCLRNYDAVFFGDNHKGFKSGRILNCGGFLRRKIDEVLARPCVGLLLGDGSIVRCYLDTTDDLFLEKSEEIELIEKEVDMTGLAEAIQSLGQDSLSFVSLITNYLNRNGVSTSVRECVMEAVSSGTDL